MTTHTPRIPQARPRQRRTLQWAIRTTPIVAPDARNAALDGSSSSYGCDGCNAPMPTQRARPLRRAVS